VTYIASAGDSGLGLFDPATFDSVAAAGGTQLSRSNGKRGFAEEIWRFSGGGCSSTKALKPSWQHDKYGKSCRFRLGNDVSAVATDAAMYDTYEENGWIHVDGTSISSPFLAGIFALAANSKRQDGGKTFWDSLHQKYLYQIGDSRFTKQGGFGSPDGIGAF
jgi:subtilase family serine protease